MQNNNTNAKTRSAAGNSGQKKRRTAFQGDKIRIDWAFRRLRNQAVKFFAGKDRELAAHLRAELKSTRTYSDMREDVVTRLRLGAQPWNAFMDQFFGHRINKQS